MPGGHIRSCPAFTKRMIQFLDGSFAESQSFVEIEPSRDGEASCCCLSVSVSLDDDPCAAAH